MPSANPLIVFEVHHQLFVVPTRAVVASRRTWHPANINESGFSSEFRYLYRRLNEA
jgi:hypothetical protein